eukprot:COSAG05_NODE_572_length_8615_cov_58.796031_11_plen_160_part_00
MPECRNGRGMHARAQIGFNGHMRTCVRVDSNSNDCVLRAPGCAAAASQHQPAGGPCCARTVYIHTSICQAVDLYCPFVTAAAARLAQSHNNLAPCCLYIVYAVYRYTYTYTYTVVYIRVGVAKNDCISPPCSGSIQITQNRLRDDPDQNLRSPHFLEQF